MDDLLCFTPDSCMRLEAGEEKAPGKEDLRKIRAGQILRDGQTIWMKARDEADENWSLLEGSDGLVFGRDLMENPDLSVSLRHFQLELAGCQYLLTDLNSANGTYVNGRRVSRHVLRDGDHIQCAGSSLVWLNGFFLCRFRHKGPSPPVWPPGEPVPAGEELQPLPVRSETVFLESWALQEPMRRQSLFLTCGSSLLMSAGSLLSAALLQLTGSAGVETVRTSLAMSLGMAASFLVYGLIQRSLNEKQNLQEIREKETAYRDYLGELRTKMQQLQTGVQQEQDRVAVLWIGLDESLRQSGSKIPAGWKEQSLLSLQLPSFSWQHRRHPLWNQIEALLEEAARSVKILTYPGPEGPVTTCIKSYVAMFVWSQDPCRIKWGGPDILDGEYPHLYFRGKRVTTQIPGLQVAGLDFKEGPGLPCDLRKLNHIRFFPDMENDVHDLTSKGSGCCIRIGADEKGEPLLLDLLRDGPHGLVAGTTGSGKSEAICTLLTDLIARNSPDQFQFIILDFKGGAFASPFEYDPHCAGVITDLEPGAMESLHLALAGEVNRREQRMKEFLESEPGAVPDFEACNRSGDRPMPLLLVIADEFAELKDQCPRELSYLQSLARIGRSLGICLLLSTQRPQGIVDSQILANTGYTLCFRMRDRYESQEVLGSPDAADLRGAGDGYFGRVRFQADYARRPWTGRTRLETEDGANIRSIEPETWMEHHLAVSRTKWTPCRRLLLPDLDGYEGPGLGIVTDPMQAKRFELMPDWGTLTLILAPDDSVSVLESLQRTYEDLREATEGNLWFLSRMKGKRTVVARDMDVSCLRDPDVRLILVLSRPLPDLPGPDLILETGQAASLCRFHRAAQDCPFPAGRKLPEGQPLLFRTEGRIHSLKKVPDRREKRDWMRIFELPVLGWSAEGPVFWQGESLAVFGQQADSLCKRLHQWRPDFAPPVPWKKETETSLVLFTDGWRQEAWRLGLPGSGGPWLLKSGSGLLSLDPLIHAG